MSIAGKKIGLALSGGGYRAAAYHIGTLRALHRLDILEKLDVISSVFRWIYNSSLLCA